jgi:hypothetical protein
MKEICAVPELLIESTDLVSRSAKLMYDTLKCLCLNRHRERGFIKQILLPAFQVLQYEAAAADEQFRNEHELKQTTPVYTTNYMILNTIRLMERYIRLGIELGLYPNWYDLSTALWYRDFLLSALINMKGTIEQEKMERREMEKLITQEEEARQKQIKEAEKKAKKGKKKGKRPKQPTSPSATPLVSTAKTEKVTAEDFEGKSNDIEYILPCTYFFRLNNVSRSGRET